jgi:hypothetical protein
MTDAHNSSNKGEFLKCLSEIFKRDLISIPIVKKYYHPSIAQRCGLKAATIELDTAAYPSIEYVAGSRLSVYPLNPPSHVQSIVEHLIDDVSPAGSGPASSTAAATSPAESISSHNSNAAASQPHYSHRVMLENWHKFVQLTGKDCLRLALTYIYDIMTAPSRELIHLLADHCHSKDQKKRLISIGQSNESWEKWLCSGHRTLKSLFEEYTSCKLSACKLLNELNIQQPRQYSISNIKSSKRFRAEIIVVQHKYSLNQIELNLRLLRDRETYEQVASPSRPPESPQPPQPPAQSRPAGHKSSLRPVSSATGGPKSASSLARGGPQSPTRPVSPKHHRKQQVVAGASRRGSKGSQRSIRSTASYASSPITTHQVKRVSSFSGPLMSAYANASSTSTIGSSDTRTSVTSSSPGGAQSERSRGSRLSLLSVLQSHRQALKSVLGGSASPGGAKEATLGSKFDGLCSNYLLNLNSNDQILCEFIENPRFTLKGNRERPIMMIGQDVGLVAFRVFLQQRQLEHERAQVFYETFKDLSPKKFGDMQLVCLTGHKSRIEDLFKRDIQLAQSKKVLSSVSYINRRHLLSLLTAATNKSQLVLSQLQQPGAGQAASKQTHSQSSPASGGANHNNSNINNTSNNQASSAHQQHQQYFLPINSKELLELGDKIYKLLVENNGCLYTCCDPHMTQAIEILTFESIARNNQQLTRERLMQLLPMWKGSGSRASEETTPDFITLENTYERARIVQEIYDSSI